MITKKQAREYFRKKVFNLYRIEFTDRQLRRIIDECHKSDFFKSFYPNKKVNPKRTKLYNDLVKQGLLGANERVLTNSQIMMLAIAIEAVVKQKSKIRHLGDYLEDRQEKLTERLEEYRGVGIESLVNLHTKTKVEVIS